MRGVEKFNTKFLNQNGNFREFKFLDSWLGEEIHENIDQSQTSKGYELFDPLSGEKVQQRRRIYWRTDVNFD